MPCKKCDNGKWQLGSGPCMYESKTTCERAYAAYRARAHENNGSRDR